MGVRVDEAGQGEQSSAVHTLTGLARGTGGYQVADLPVGDDDVDGRHAPGADIGQSQISHAEMVYRGPYVGLAPRRLAVRDDRAQATLEAP